MNAPKQRRIQVASFSKDDVSSGHVAAFAGGAVLIAAAVATAWVGALNLRAVAEAKGAARQAMAVSAMVSQGAQGFGLGSAQRLSMAVSLSASAASAHVELRSTVASPFMAPGLRAPAVSANGAWVALSGALSDVQPSVARSAELSDALGKAAGSVSALLKQIEASGRQTTTLARAHDSALRLYTYAESGFGPASATRVDYDLRVLAADLAATDLRGAAAFVDPLLPLAKSAAGTPISREQLARLNDAASTAKAAGESLGLAALQSSAGLWLGATAGALGLAGLALLWWALRSVLDDFGRRYVRAMSQFRGGEGARKELVAKLRAAIDQGEDDFSLEDPSSEMREVAELVSELSRRHFALLQQVARAVGSAVDGETDASKSISTIEAQSKDIQVALAVVSERLSAIAARARVASVDAAAAAHAAEEAGQRSADANRVAQDSASRLEALREGLQETAKGVKRLGERTQDIYGVVDSMELLSEQIGVLSLNASLEAERAGEAGAGFRLVAKEVQALARRSEQALSLMSSLVQGAQADARSAAEAVERSTSQVVAGSNVGAVSQALLVAMSPLALSVESMTRSIADAAKESAEALQSADFEAGRSRGSVVEMGSVVDRLKAPLRQVREKLAMAGSLAGGAR